MSFLDTRYEDHAWAGQEIIVDTNNHTGNFTGLLIIADAVVGDVEWETTYNATGNWSSFTLIPAGVYLPGKFSMIQLASGQAIAIRRKMTP
jgi:hypothetical protein